MAKTREFMTVRGQRVGLEAQTYDEPGRAQEDDAWALYIDGKLDLVLTPKEARGFGELLQQPTPREEAIAQANAALKVGAELEAKGVNEETKSVTLTEVLRWANSMPEHFKVSRIGEVYRREVEKSIRQQWGLK